MAARTGGSPTGLVRRPARPRCAGTATPPDRSSLSAGRVGRPDMGSIDTPIPPVTAAERTAGSPGNSGLRGRRDAASL